MHTPDGFLTSWVCVLTLLITLGAIGLAVVNIKKVLTKQKVYLMAALAAIIFGFQMLNFPIAAGTSGHFLGAGIVAILLGPHAAVLVLAVVLVVQTFVYGDGGVLAIGANIFNMGVIGGYSAYYTYKSLKDKSKLLAGFLASWSSVMAASLVAALELGVSGTSPLLKALSAMGITHLFIGLGEAIITTGILFYIIKTKQDVLEINKQPTRLAKYAVITTILALIVTSFALPFASGAPDGLEKVALNLGFFEKATTIYTLAPMPDYTFLGQESYLFVLIAGIIGMVATFSLSYIVTKPLAAKA